MITYDESHRFFRYEKETGKIFWKEKTYKSSKIPIGTEAGGVRIDTHGKTSYIQIKFRGKYYQAHRLVWLMVYGEFIDHIDGDGLNNRIVNLRAVSNREQNHNRQLRDDNTSGYNGVSYHKQTCKWLARINRNGKRLCLGSFTTPELANEVVAKARKEYGKYSERHGK